MNAAKLATGTSERTMPIALLLTPCPPIIRGPPTQGQKRSRASDSRYPKMTRARTLMRALGDCEER